MTGSYFRVLIFSSRKEDGTFFEYRLRPYKQRPTFAAHPMKLSTAMFSSARIVPRRHPDVSSTHPTFFKNLASSEGSISCLGLSMATHPISLNSRRSLCVSSSSKAGDGAPPSPPQGAESFMRSVLQSMEIAYLNRNPTAKAVLDLVRSAGEDQISYDHLAFRTFGVNDHGIDSMASFFLEHGYTPREELRFPAKKLRALWFSPPKSSLGGAGSRVQGPLPRIFISELLVDQMSPQAQEIIRRYTGISASGNKYAALASALGTLTWERPLHSEFQLLARESEYAAWTLVNGYALNHVTISAHQLKSTLRSINNLNKFIEDNGFKLNSEGGVLKVSPDGLLQQSSTVADSFPFQFSDGVTEAVPCSYIEFAERLVLPQFQNLPEKEVKEIHRRDGFEVGNADKIFESTSKEQLTRRVA